MPTTADKRAAFRRLHESGCFVIPNPWDIGTVKYLQNMGFKALATTSAGFAWSRGLRRRRRHARCHARPHRRAVGRGRRAHECRLRGRLCARAGGRGRERAAVLRAPACRGCRSRTTPATRPRRSTTSTLAVARVKAARAAIDKAGGDVLLTGRSEGFIRGLPDLDETIRRLKAYAAAGADCLYSPGISTREQIAAVCKAVAPKPVNLLIGGPARSDRRRHRRPRRAPHLHRRRAGARGVGRHHAHHQADRRSRQLQGLRRRGPRRGDHEGVEVAMRIPLPAGGERVG